MSETVTTLPPGEALDKRVAAAIGWREEQDGFGGTQWYSHRGKQTEWGTPSGMGSVRRRFAPSTDSASAVEVVETLRDSGLEVSIQAGLYAYSVAIGPKGERVSSKTFPHAVSLAVLRLSESQRPA